MKKFVAICGFLYYENLYGDYTGRLPSSITLQNNENKSYKLTSTCGNQYCYAGLPNAFNPSAYDFSYNTNNGTSSLTIESTTPQNNINQTQSILYMGKLSVGTNSTLLLKDFHTISIQKGVTVHSNATLNITMQKGKINASEFGPSSKIIFSRGADIYLSSGAMFQASNMDFFILDSMVSIQNGSTMNVESSTIRIQNSLQNHGTLKLQGSVWNVGQSGNGISLATSNFINTEGNVTIQGDFHNGGKPTADTQNNWWQNDAPSPGGGNLINYGGQIHITGKLTNEQGKENLSTQDSSVELYGGSLKVDGGMTNDSNSTLVFGTYNGQMGKLEGDLTNNGKVVVYTSGVSMGKHELITGKISGNTDFDIVFKSGANEFISANMQNGTLNINADSTKIKSFQSTLSSNEQSIINSLDLQLNGIYTYGGSTLLRNVAQDTELGLKNSFITMPLAILDSMQSDFISLSNTQTLSVDAFGGGIIASGSSGGGFGGVRAGYNLGVDSNLLAAYFAYGYGRVGQSSDLYSGTLQSNVLSVTLMDRILLGKVFVDASMFFALGFFSMQDMLDFSGTSMKFLGSFNSYNLQANVALNYPIAIQDFTITPFFGLRQSAVIQSAYKSEGSMQIQDNGYTNNITSLLFGINADYALNSSSIFLNISYEQSLYNSSKHTQVLLNNQALLIDTMPLKYGVAMNTGANLQINGNMRTNFQAFYKMSKSLSHIVGLQANFSYQF